MLQLCEFEILSKLCAYYESQRVYFQTGLELLNKTVPELQLLTEKVLRKGAQKSNICGRNETTMKKQGIHKYKA